MNIFLNSSEHKTFPISSISLATCGTSAIFGSVRIELFGEFGHSHIIDHLWRDEAVKAVMTINGLRSCHKANIDLSQFDLEYLKKQVALLGDY